MGLIGSDGVNTIMYDMDKNGSLIKKKKSHLHFYKDEDYKGKTEIWYVVSNHDGTDLGIIKWNTGWRCYWFEPDSECGFSSDCLLEIYNKINDLMEKRK